MKRHANRHEDTVKLFKRVIFGFNHHPRLKGSGVKDSLDRKFGKTSDLPNANWNELSYRRYY